MVKSQIVNVQVRFNLPVELRRRALTASHATDAPGVHFSSVYPGFARMSWTYRASEAGSEPRGASVAEPLARGSDAHWPPA